MCCSVFTLCSSTVAMAGERPEGGEVTLGQGHFLSRNFNAERSSNTRKGLDSVTPTPAIASSKPPQVVASKPLSSQPVPPTSAPESWAVESDPLLAQNSFNTIQPSTSLGQRMQNATQMPTQSSLATPSVAKAQPAHTGVLQPSTSALTTGAFRQASVAPMEPAMRPQSTASRDGMPLPTPAAHSYAPSVEVRPHTSATLFSGMSLAPSSSMGAPPPSLPQPQAVPTQPQWHHQHTPVLAPSVTLQQPPAPVPTPQTASLFTDMSMGYPMQQQAVSPAPLQPAPMPARLTPVQGTFESASQPPMAMFSNQGNYYPSAASQSVNAPAMGGAMWSGNQGVTHNMFATPQRTVAPLSKQDLEDLLS